MRPCGVSEGELLGRGIAEGLSFLSLSFVLSFSFSFLFFAPFPASGSIPRPGGNGVPRGRSSGMSILLRCTTRLRGGVYSFPFIFPLAGPSSSLIILGPFCFSVSYKTYWWSSGSPALCRIRFVSSTTCRTFGTCGASTDRTLINSIASSWSNREQYFA